MRIFIIIIVVVTITFGWRVFIDPGHGGPGAAKYSNNGGGHNAGQGSLGPNRELTEQWVNLEISSSTMLKYSNAYYTVTMSRFQWEDDYSLAERVYNANVTFYAHIFLSVHHNGLPLNDQGTETFFCRDYGNPNSGRLAINVKDWLIWAFGYYDRGAKDDYEALQLHLYVCRYTTMPAENAEASNLYNEDEEDLMEYNLAHRESEAWGHFYGGDDFFTGIEEKYLNAINQRTEVFELIPNPANKFIVLEMLVPSKENIDVRIHDANGRLVNEFSISPEQTPHCRIKWDLRNQFSKRIPSGIYFFKLKTGNLVSLKKAIISGD